MTHQAIQDLVWRLHDRELAESERALLQAHLSGCAGCSEIARRVGRQHQLLATAPQPAASEAFVESLMRRLPETAREPQPVSVPRFLRPWRILERLSLGVAAAGLLMAVMIRQQPAIATEALLRSDWPQQEGWAFSSESPEAGLLLGSTGELQ